MSAHLPFYAFDKLSRRAALSALSLTLSPLVGCAGSSPRPGPPGLLPKSVDVFEPTYEPNLKLKTTDFARPISAINTAWEEGEINNAIGPWAGVVVGRFVESLIIALRVVGFDVDSASRNDSARQERAKQSVSIRGSITAGFVYKTWTSATYTPYVQGVLGADLPNGTALYRQLLSVSDRSLNSFITNFSLATRYAFNDVAALQSEREQATDALGILAAQLGGKFAFQLAALWHEI